MPGARARVSFFLFLVSLALVHAGPPEEVQPYFRALQRAGLLPPVGYDPGPQRPFSRNQLIRALRTVGSSSELCWLFSECATERDNSGAGWLADPVWLRDHGMFVLPDGKTYGDHGVDRYQLAYAFAGLLRHLQDGDIRNLVDKEVDPEDVPRDHWAREAVEVVVSSGLMPEYRDHFHGRYRVNQGQFRLLYGRILQMAFQVQDSHPTASGESKRQRLLGVLREADLPFALRIALAREGELEPGIGPLPVLPETTPRKTYGEDLSRTVAKYPELDRVPANSIRWLARQHQKSEDQVLSDLGSKFGPADRGASWLTSAAPPIPPAPPVVSAHGKTDQGFSRFLRKEDDQIMIEIPGSRLEIDGLTVELDSFLIDQTEVSVGQYARFLAETGHPPPPTSTAWLPMTGLPFQGRELDVSWELQRVNPELPVVMVSWHDARAYAEWVGAQLPTDAQWLLAAQGPVPRPYPWGENWWGHSPEHLEDIARQLAGLAGSPDAEGVTPVGDVGWLTSPHLVAHFHAPFHPDGAPAQNLAPLARAPFHLTPVGSHPEGASPYGVMEMAGNVREWCADWFAPNQVEFLARRNPLGPEQGQKRVLRGGSIDYTPEQAVLQVRRSMDPNLRRPEVGFRLASPAP